MVKKMPILVTILSSFLLIACSGTTKEVNKIESAFAKNDTLTSGAFTISLNQGNHNEGIEQETNGVFIQTDSEPVFYSETIYSDRMSTKVLYQDKQRYEQVTSGDLDSEWSLTNKDSDQEMSDLLPSLFDSDLEEKHIQTLEKDGQIYTVTLNDQFITDQIADLKEEMADAMDDIRDSDLDSKEDILAAYEQSLELSLLLLENTSSYAITYTIDQDGYLTETKIEHHYQTDDQDTYLIHTTSLTDYPLDKPESLIPQIEG